MIYPDSKAFSDAMKAACREARRWLGATSPNPPVGTAALDDAGRILAVAAHRRAGEDHAEAALLKLCEVRGLLPRIDTLCVTMEPCNHQGRTPPCTEAILKSGIRRVAIGMRDPNRQVAGGGCERLRDAGIEVIETIESESCRRLAHAFAFHAQTGKPFVTVKRAFDEKGSMIPPKGQKTFTSRESLILAHRLRKKADAIVTGSGTILADRPSFTVRHVKDFGNKNRILAILDRKGRVPDTYIKEASARGFSVQLFQDLDSCFSSLEKKGIRDILIESGPNLSRSVVDSPYWAMKIDIHRESPHAPDKIDIAFNPIHAIPFDINNLDIESLLPL